MPTYAEIRQQVLATLKPGVDAMPVLWGLAYAALQDGVQGAALELLTAGGEARAWDLVEAAMAGLEAHWGAELAQLQAAIAADPRPRPVVLKWPNIKVSGQICLILNGQASLKETISWRDSLFCLRIKMLHHRWGRT